MFRHSECNCWNNHWPQTIGKMVVLLDFRHYKVTRHGKNHGQKLCRNLIYIPASFIWWPALSLNMNHFITLKVDILLDFQYCKLARHVENSMLEIVLEYFLDTGWVLYCPPAPRPVYNRSWIITRFIEGPIMMFRHINYQNLFSVWHTGYPE